MISFQHITGSGVTRQSRHWCGHLPTPSPRWRSRRSSASGAPPRPHAVDQVKENNQLFGRDGNRERSRAAPATTPSGHGGLGFDRLHDRRHRRRQVRSTGDRCSSGRAACATASWISFRPMATGLILFTIDANTTAAGNPRRSRSIGTAMRLHGRSEGTATRSTRSSERRSALRAHGDVNGDSWRHFQILVRRGDGAGRDRFCSVAAGEEPIIRSAPSPAPRPLIRRHLGGIDLIVRTLAAGAGGRGGSRPRRNGALAPMYFGRLPSRSIAPGAFR